MPLLNCLLCGGGDRPFSQQSISGATDTIDPTLVNIELVVSSPTTMTSTPTIANGIYDNQQVIIRGSNNTNTITLQSVTNLGGSNLFMDGGVDIVLGENDYIVFRWNNTTSNWCEQSRSVNS